MKTFIYFLIVSSLSGALQFGSASEIQDEIAELRVEIEDLKREMGDVVKLRENIEISEKEIAAAIVELPPIEEEVAELEMMRNVYRSAYRVVTSVPKGTAMGDIRLNDGSTVPGSVFLGATGSGLSVQSANGPRVIALDLLPSEIRSQLSLPASGDQSVASYDELKAMKPRIAKGREELAAEVAAEREREALAKAAADAAAAAEKLHAAANPILSTGSGDVEYDDYKKIQAMKFEDLKALRAQYRDVEVELKNARRAKHDQVNEFYRSNIKVAKYEQDKALASHDARIEAILKKKELIWAQIKVVQEQ